MPIWINDDGLKVKSGTDEVTAVNGGSFREHGSVMKSEVELDLSTMTAGTKIFLDGVQLPKGAVVESVSVVVGDTVAAGGTSLDIGTIGTDYVSLDVDNALVAAIPLASMDAIGETTAGTGVLVGSETTAAVYLTATATGTFTAGKVTVRVNYRYTG